MSWVFLTDQYAWKLKKPLHNVFLDFRSVPAREHACAEELRLNRRLAPHIYLSVETISQRADGTLQFGPGVAVVDYVIRMRRLPDQVMLSSQLVHGSVRGSVSDAVLERVAGCIARFHRGLPPLRPSLMAWRTLIYKTIDANEAVLKRYLAFLPALDVHRVCHQQRTFLFSHASWIDARVHQGCVVEGHGDLRAEHVFVGDEVGGACGDTVGAIDCLEFSAALRQLDRADEIAFLALDCERLAGEAVGSALLQRYQSIIHDYPPPPLLHFYQSFRAAIRARLAIQRLSEYSHRPRQVWIDRSRRWLRLALKHAVLMCLDQVCISSTIDPPS